AYGSIDTSDPEAVMALLLEYWFPRHFCTAPLPASMGDGLAKMNGAYSTHFIGPNLFEPSGEVMSWDRSNALAALQLPVQVIFGAQDYLTLPDMEAMAQALPNASLAVSEQASHSAWIEDPDFVRETLAEFFSDNGLA
ncbi:MAG: alpha/beta fold hydrolase, partial [Spirochaetota bacterium]